MSTKRPLESYEGDNYDQPPAYKQKIEDEPVALQSSLYDDGSWANKVVDISASVQSFIDFTHLCEYEKATSFELGQPSSENREVPLLEKAVIHADSGNSHSINSPLGVVKGQSFPAITGINKGLAFHVLMGPFKISNAFSYPLGNYQREYPDDGKKNKQRFVPMEPHEVKNLKYSLSVSASEADQHFNTKDPLAQEQFNWLTQYQNLFGEIALSEAEVKIEPKYFAQGFKTFEAKYAPFRLINAKTKLTEDATHCPHKEFEEFTKKGKYAFEPLKVFRLNPDRFVDETAPPLITVPSVEQPAYLKENDMVMLCFKINRYAGGKHGICTDLHHVIALEGGYKGPPGIDWFSQAKPRVSELTPEKLYEIPQQTPKVWT